MGELPDGWIKTELSKILDINPKSLNDDNLQCSFIPMSHVPVDYHGELRKNEAIWKDVKKGKTHFQDGDVIFAKITPCFENGKASIISSLENSQGAGSTEYFVLRVSEAITKEYLYALLKSREFLKSGELVMSGSVGHKRVPKDFVASYLIPLPPLNEQIRIANKIDSLLAKVEAAQTRLDKIPTLLKRFRQSVLAAATSGELTKEWRSGQGDSWNEIKVGDIVKKIEAGKNIKCDERPPQEDEFGIIKISAVTWGVYNESKSKTLFDTTKFIENRRIQVGDFLISRANTLELLGMPVIVQKVSKNLMLSDKVLRLVVNEAIDKKWLNFFLRSQRGRREIESRATGNQQSMRNIGQKALLDIDLPYPEREEQKQIVHQVESLFTLADKVEKQYQQARLRTDKLSQSLLAKAFKGELVPQDPNDEPAEKLLARILEERETLKPAKKSRKAK